MGEKEKQREGKRKREELATKRKINTGIEIE